jgi:hypothetical protein
MTDGDPQTPNYPSLDGVYRTDIEELKRTVLPKIPCQPVRRIYMSVICVNVVDKNADYSCTYLGSLGGETRSQDNHSLDNRG